MRHLGIGEAAGFSRTIPAKASGETLRRLAVVGSLAGAVLTALGLMAFISGGVALIAMSSGLADGGEANALVLTATGLACAALAAVAGGLARAAARASDEMPEDVLLVTRHGARGDVACVDRRQGPFADAPVSSFSGMALFERVLVADRPLFLSAVQDAARGRAQVCELRLRCDSGGEMAPAFMTMEARCRLVPGGLVRVVWRPPWQAAAAERQKADAAARARAEAEAASAAKSHFLAAMSHELRTPLNAILGFSELLATDAGLPLDEARKADYARIIHESGQHLLGLVNDILDLSRVEAGAYVLEREEVEVVPLVSGCAEMVALEAARAGVAVRTAFAAGLPSLSADRRALRQIVLNLMSNAVKFTPEGGQVKVSVRLQGDILSIRVRDTGAGMRPEDVARLGEPFFQAGDCSQRARGSGLGIAVVKGLVTLHGGDLRVESAPGRGTSVTVSLPRGVAAWPSEATGGVVAPFPARLDDARAKRTA